MLVNISGGLFEFTQGQTQTMMMLSTYLIWIIIISRNKKVLFKILGRYGGFVDVDWFSKSLSAWTNSERPYQNYHLNFLKNYGRHYVRQKWRSWLKSIFLLHSWKFSPSHTDKSMQTLKFPNLQKTATVKLLL